jgi:hypothetical protein
MASIIVLQNGTADKALQNAAQLSSTESIKVMLIGSNCQTATQQGVNCVQAVNGNIAEALWNAVKESSDSDILILDGEISLTPEMAQNLFAAHAAGSATMTIPTLQTGSETNESFEMQADTLTKILEPNSSISFGAALVSTSALSEIAPVEAITAPQCIGMLAVSAVGMHMAINTTSVILETEEEAFRNIVEKTHNAKAQILRHAVNSVNIEEIFPNHAWSAHGNECAAACYHTLSAQFIRLSDMESALECLSLSDQLEDSPRSLALRGLIALGQGETLQAVANMVSSLQEYEKRKEDEERVHYLTFTPKDLEKVNTDLQSGLDALNKRDNSTALEFFSDAVFEFDSFYEDCGLRELKPTLAN